MVGIVDTDIRTNKSVVANRDLTTVEYNTAKIDIYITANRDILAELTTKIWFYLYIFTDRFEEFLHNFFTLFYPIIFCAVISTKQLFRLNPSIKQILIEIIINLTSLQLLPFWHIQSLIIVHIQEYYHSAIFPAIPKSRVAVAMPNA